MNIRTFFDELEKIAQSYIVPDKSLYWTSDIEPTLSGPMSWRYAGGEWKEMLDELRKVNWPGVKEELGDALYSSYLAARHSTGLNLPMLGANEVIRKFRTRFPVWEKIFHEEGLEFSPKYLSGGSNYHKPEKIEAALSLARADQR